MDPVVPRLSVLLGRGPGTRTFRIRRWCLWRGEGLFPCDESTVASSSAFPGPRLFSVVWTNSNRRHYSVPSKRFYGHHQWHPQTFTVSLWYHWATFPMPTLDASLIRKFLYCHESFITSCLSDWPPVRQPFQQVVVRPRTGHCHFMSSLSAIRSTLPFRCILV